MLGYYFLIITAIIITSLVFYVNYKLVNKWRYGRVYIILNILAFAFFNCYYLYSIIWDSQGGIALVWGFYIIFISPLYLLLMTIISFFVSKINI
jgi:hypothetical protein